LLMVLPIVEITSGMTIDDELVPSSETLESTNTIRLTVRAAETPYATIDNARGALPSGIMLIITPQGRAINMLPMAAMKSPAPKAEIPQNPLDSGAVSETIASIAAK